MRLSLRGCREIEKEMQRDVEALYLKRRGFCTCVRFAETIKSALDEDPRSFLCRSRWEKLDTERIRYIRLRVFKLCRRPPPSCRRQFWTCAIFLTHIIIALHLGRVLDSARMRKVRAYRTIGGFH